MPNTTAWLDSSIIFETITGSRMYGTATPQSDVDLRGICIPPMNVLLDPFQSVEQFDSFPDTDRVVYNMSKFFDLCSKANPNIIELLFAPKECWIHSTLQWHAILFNRDLFVSKKVRYTFSGYGFAQLKAIKTHRQWFVDPPKHKPTREDFGLTDSPEVSGDKMSALLVAVTGAGKESIDPKLQDIVMKEKAYRDSKTAWDNYKSWYDNRNPARRDLEDKFGYDTKHASHLFRLLDEGKELLLTGKITFPLINKNDILDIRNGALTYEQVVERATQIDLDFNEWYKESPLPHGPDINRLKDLYFKVLGMVG